MHKTLRVAITLIVVLLAILAGTWLWHFYLYTPWTRDARVRADVVVVAPDVSGWVTRLAVVDNQLVKPGDLLMQIDQQRYQANLAHAKAVAETRLLMEPECAALAAQKASPAQIGAIRAAHEAMSLTDGPAEHDRAFHSAIANGCGNAALAAAISHIWQLSSTSPVFHRLEEHFVTTNVWVEAQKEHERILAAITDRDPIRARHAMHDHLVGIMARLREDFGSGGIR